MSATETSVGRTPSGVLTTKKTRTMTDDFLVRLIDNSLPPGSVFVDVGAGDGEWSRHLASRGCRVIAIDVDFERMSAWNDPGIELLCIPIYSRDHAALYLIDTDEGKRTMEFDEDGDEEHWTVGEVVTSGSLDTVLANEDRIDIIRFAMNGTEPHGLRGAVRTLDKFRPPLLVDVHDPEATEVALRDVGYRHSPDLWYGTHLRWVCLPGT